jgi:hypothetical protein
LDSYRLECQKEKEELEYLQEKRMKLEALVRQFENDDEVYDKIRKTAEEKLNSILSDRKMVLKLALLSLIESMRKDLDRYSQLIYHNTPSAANYNSQYYDTASYGQQQQYPSQHCIDMLL